MNLNNPMVRNSLMILEGCLIVALGIQFFTSSNLVIGGTAGLSIILKQLTGLSFGVLFFLVNIPFYILAIKQMGLAFTIRTFISVSILSVLSDFLAVYVTFKVAHPLIGSVLGGALIGFGLILIFRSGSSLGGINILALFLDKRYRINPGRTIMTTDIIIVGSATFVFGLKQILFSMVAIFVMSSILGRYHKTAPIVQNSPAKA
jgi:uncharacterized membrane-anchored protein YitT (DUF2179 family)